MGFPLSLCPSRLSMGRREPLRSSRVGNPRAAVWWTLRSLLLAHQRGPGHLRWISLLVDRRGLAQHPFSKAFSAAIFLNFLMKGPRVNFKFLLNAGIYKVLIEQSSRS